MEVLTLKPLNRQEAVVVSVTGVLVGDQLRSLVNDMHACMEPMIHIRRLQSPSTRKLKVQDDERDCGEGGKRSKRYRTGQQTKSNVGASGVETRYS